MGLKNNDSNDWRVFFRSSKRRLICVLWHNSNKLGSVPITHSIKAEEEYITISLVMVETKYMSHNYDRRIGLKMCQRWGYTKHQYIVCLWNRRDKLSARTDWPSGEALVLGKYCLLCIINSELMKQNVKALIKDEECFKYWKDKSLYFWRSSDQKINKWSEFHQLHDICSKM